MPKDSVHKLRLLNRVNFIRSNIMTLGDRLHDHYSDYDKKRNEKTQEIEARLQSMHDDLATLEEYVKQMP